MHPLFILAIITHVYACRLLVQGAAITSNQQWLQVCNSDSAIVGLLHSRASNDGQAAFTDAFASIVLLGLFVVSTLRALT